MNEDKILYSVELPTEMLQGFSQYIDYDFIIASTWLEDPAYREYYLNNKRDYTILDNGAFETGKSIPVNQYASIIKELDPDIIVIPDVRYSYENTIKVAEEFLQHEELSDIRRNRDLMGVLQGTSLADYENLLNYYKMHGANIIGIPYGIIDRVPFMRKHPETTFHVLGLPYFPELLSIRLLPNVDSIDSSLPVKFAYQNELFMHNNIITVDARPPKGYEFTTTQSHYLRENLNMFRKLCDKSFKSTLL